MELKKIILPITAILLLFGAAILFSELGDNGPWMLGCLPVYNDQCQNMTVTPAFDSLAENVTIPG
jgi:hypothetical protein